MFKQRRGRPLRIDGGGLLIRAYGLSTAVKPPEQLATFHKQCGIGGILRQAAVNIGQSLLGGIRSAYFT